VAVGAGHGERQAVSCRSGSVALGRNRMPMVVADVTACAVVRGCLWASSPGAVAGTAQRLGCAAVCGGGQDEFHCGGRFTRQPGWTTCGWALARVRTQYATTPLRIGSTLRAHGCRLAMSLRRAGAGG
jgi:hypothetical protein